MPPGFRLLQRTASFLKPHRSASPLLYGPADKIALEMRCDPATSPAELTSKQIVAMHDLLHQVRFSNPDGSHLSPAGAARPAGSLLGFCTELLTLRKGCWCTETCRIPCCAQGASFARLQSTDWLHGTAHPAVRAEHWPR